MGDEVDDRVQPGIGGEELSLADVYVNVHLVINVWVVPEANKTAATNALAVSRKDSHGLGAALTALEAHSSIWTSSVPDRSSVMTSILVVPSRTRPPCG
jgi:hypothetical protein